MKIHLRPKALFPIIPALCFIGQGALHHQSLAQQQLPTQQQPVPAEEPVFLGNPWQLAPDAWFSPDISLSPDGKYVAAFCLARGAEVPKPSPISGEISFATKELVIWRVSDQKEIVRLSTELGSIQWSHAGDILRAGSKRWKWNQETLVPFSWSEQTPNPPTTIADSEWAGPIQVRQSGKDGSDLYAVNTDTGTLFPAFPHVVRLIQELSPEAQQAPRFESQTLDVIPTTPLHAVNIVCSREIIPPDDVPFGSELRYASIARWDITTGKRLWEYQTRYAEFPPKVSVSPNGLLIAVLGAASPDAPALQAHNTRLEDLPQGSLADHGIEILDAATGKRLSSFVLNYPDSDLNRGNVQWYRKGLQNALVVSDWRWVRGENGPWPKQRLLRFFDPRTGRETQRADLTKYWPFGPGYEADKQTWSLSADGQVWALATVSTGTHVFRTSTLPAAN